MKSLLFFFFSGVCLFASQPREEGFLQVSDTHAIFYATYGNPQGIPVVAIHGGPGAGFNEGMASPFDLNVWNVILFDQRGAMRSTPFACMEDNTPQHSVEDIEKLRKHCGIDRWVVSGGSWGSSLALLYGQSHPENCLGFILRGVWLVREPDYMHLLYGMGKIFPEAYQKVIDQIPEEERGDLLSACYNRVMHSDPNISLTFARAFMFFDAVAATHLPNPALVDAMVSNDKLVLGVMKTFLHYAKHQFFLRPNQVLEDMHKIAHLPAIIVHGRWDAICLPEMAYSLHQKWSGSKLWMIPDGGHSASDPGIAKALAKAADVFAQDISK